MTARHKIIAYTKFLLLLIFIVGCKKEKSRICELYDGSVGYAVGKIDRFYTTPGKVTYIYSFEADGSEHEGKEKAYGIGQKDETLLGKYFIVIYASGNPSNSDLNTDFAMNSDNDFQEFKTEYSSGPPPPDFPNNCN